MGDPFIGEIRHVGFDFPPVGWAACDGRIMSISQNPALFSILGTYYGGNGQTTFALPDLRNRFAMAVGNGPGLSPHVLGEMAGSETVTLLSDQMPVHSHTPLASAKAGDVESPANASWAQPRSGRVPDKAYATGPTETTMAPQALQTAGGGQPHNNMPPYLTTNYIIALEGIYPSRS
jgi:microcystin-dependent protein